MSAAPKTRPKYPTSISRTFRRPASSRSSTAFRGALLPDPSALLYLSRPSALRVVSPLARLLQPPLAKIVLLGMIWLYAHHFSRGSASCCSTFTRQGAVAASAVACSCSAGTTFDRVAV
jgi:hypothetical protein